MSVTILEIKQNTPEWHKIRETHLTGSNADILLTRGLEQALKANLNRFNGNFYTKRGHILEEEAIEIYEAINACTVSRPGFVVNDRFPNVGCSPDGIVEDILIEVKCFGENKHMEIQNLKSIPFKIMAQLQFNMMICELPQARLVLYNPDITDNVMAYREIEVKANKNIFNNIIAKIGKQHGKA